jgi:hypothetical protein
VPERAATAIKIARAENGSISYIAFFYPLDGELGQGSKALHRAFVMRP